MAQPCKSSLTKKVEATARATKFVQRLSPLSGFIFLQASVFGFIDDPQANLDDLAGYCADLGVELSVQGFDQRINAAAVAFFKEMLRQAMAHFKHTLPLPLPILQQFSAVNLVDSTSLSLPATMLTEYPGCGGDGPPASLKVQLNFEFLYGNLEQIVLRPGNEPDQKFAEPADWVQPGSLNLRDLGYFSLDHLQTIAATKQAYYLSRFLPGTGLVTPAGQPLKLSEVLKHHPRQPFEMDVLLGVDHHLPTRLIAIPLSQEVADRRRQRAKEKAQRKGRTLSAAYLASLDWLIFVTNVPQAMLSIEQAALLYRVRWQIELVFKLWKSYGGLQRTQALRRERVLYELYAKMIGLVLTQFLLTPWRMPAGPGANHEASMFKIRDILQDFAKELMRAVPVWTELLAVLTRLSRRIERLGFKQKRTKQPNICHALALASSLYILDLEFDQELELPVLLA
ncbi:MAG: IS4 family transposase [Pseudomonadota bacterium]